MPLSSTFTKHIVLISLIFNNGVSHEIPLHLIHPIDKREDDYAFIFYVAKYCHLKIITKGRTESDI